MSFVKLEATSTEMLRSCKENMAQQTHYSVLSYNMLQFRWLIRRQRHKMAYVSQLSLKRMTNFNGRIINTYSKYYWQSFEIPTSSCYCKRLIYIMSFLTSNAFKFVKLFCVERSCMKLSQFVLYIWEISLLPLATLHWAIQWRRIRWIRKCLLCKPFVLLVVAVKRQYRNKSVLTEEVVGTTRRQYKSKKKFAF
jgi:hypothetical protein